MATQNLIYVTATLRQVIQKLFPTSKKTLRLVDKDKKLLLFRSK